MAKKKHHPSHRIHGPNIFDPNCITCRKHGLWVSKTENRHLLDPSDPDYHSDFDLKFGNEKPQHGYHRVPIKKGTLGEISKIQEELDELADAEHQGVRILMMCELADLYGALRAYAKKYNLKMSDLHDMAKLTRHAFKTGVRSDGISTPKN